MLAKARFGVLAAAAAWLGAGAPVCGAGVPGFGGSIAGWVTDASGSPRMGAAVLLLDRVEREVQRALTDESGTFLFAPLTPGTYSLRVNLASFLPALKRNIEVQPGMRSLLKVNLAGLFSTVELVYSSGGGAVMSDDWKWALRGSASTRPVLRFHPAARAPAEHRSGASDVFSDTRGMVRISAGDESRVSQYGNEADLGTAFALATSVFGENQIQFSGNFGYSAANGAPSAGFRTSYSRGPRDGQSAEVSVTMRQLFLPVRAGAGILTGQDEASPALRTMSVGFLDEAQIAPNLRLEYGFSLESVSFLDTLNYFSPYGRLTYTVTGGETVEFAYSSGVPPVALFPGLRDSENDLQRDIASLGLFPRVSLRGGHARVQRSANYELAYRRTLGSRTFGAAVYREWVNNAALTLVAPAGTVPAAELLPDLLSNSAVFNVGDYAAAGYMASLTQALGDHWSVTLAAGSGNALVPVSSELKGSSPDELRTILRHGRQAWLAARASFAAPSTGTLVAATYRSTDRRSLTAGHMYLTQTLRPDTGLGIYIRQPIPILSSRFGQLEATADLRNLCAEGYVPVEAAGGKRVTLLHTPRSVRGGLSFIF